MTTDIHIYKVGMGSNHRAPRQLAHARARLSALFPGIRFSPEERTPAIGMKHNDAPFLNQAASFQSPLSAAAVRRHLKALEQESGRTPAGKALEIIPLDLDLLMADGRELRPADCHLPHVQRALSWLTAHTPSPSERDTTHFY